MKRLRLVALLATFPLVLSACGSDSSDSSGVEVVAAFYPLQFIAEQVGGTDVTVTNLTSPGVEPHDLELAPKQVGLVHDADLVVFEKDLQPAVDKAVKQADRSADSTVDTSTLATIKDDPHLWLDPRAMITITQQVAKSLADIDPDRTDQYAARASTLIDELTALDESFARGLKKCKLRTIVTSHAAFGYLAQRYDLTQVAIAGIDPTNEPSPAALGRITQLVRKQGITTVFTEELVSPAIANTVAKESGATTAVLDPIEGLSDDTASDSYVTLMRANLKALRKANGCS